MLPTLIDGSGFNKLVRAKHGWMLFNRHDVYIGRSIGKYGEFSEGEIALFAQFCRAGDVVVEVGANIGAHTLALANLVGAQGRVHAFEAQRVVFQTLCANVALNSLTHVECHHLALGAQTGMLKLPDFVYSQEGNFGGVEISQFAEGLPVPLARLDDTLDLTTCKLIKIDVEGMEREVIAGATSTIGKHRPFLYVENDRVEKSSALIDAIEALGYRAWWSAPPMYNP
ncbi:MAG: FkbM family methyltransferase, partial [Betaproteobacteria bacterium]|nr:FkbM family methyltransferase [Betaproteobacteria bacterium]